MSPKRGNRFSEEDLRRQMKLEHVTMQFNRDVL
jgi:hypothetical protein